MATSVDSISESNGAKARLRRFYFGYFCAMGADQLWLTSLGWTAGHLGDGASTGLVLACAAVPRAFFMLFGGVLVDILGLRATVIYSQYIRIVVAIASVFMLGLRDPSLGALVAIAVLFGLADSICVPALSAAPNIIAGPEAAPRVVSMTQALQRSAMLAGSIIAGGVIAVMGLGPVYVAAVLLFSSGVAFLTSADLPRAVVNVEDEPRSPVKSALEGFHYISKRGMLIVVIITIALLNFLIQSAFNVGIPTLTAARSWPATIFGLVEAGFGAGAVVGAVAAARFRTPRDLYTVGLTWVLLEVPLLVALAVFPAPWVAVLACFGIGVTLGPASAYLFGYVQKSITQGMSGRVMSVVTFASVGISPFAYLAFGFAADALGTELTFSVCAACLATLVVLFLALSRRLQGGASNDLDESAPVV